MKSSGHQAAVYSFLFSLVPKVKTSLEWRQ